MKEYATDSGAAIPEVDPASGVRGTYQRVWSAPAALPEVDPASYAPDSVPLPVSVAPGSVGIVTDDSGDQFAHLPLNMLVPSLTNPRKNFNAAKLAELAESIKASGVHQTIMVRPLPGSRVQETSREAHRGQKHQGYVVPTHEIVSGERRYRASLLAGVATIPARIRQLTDGQVLEIQIVENLQRDDLTELEEAEGYERLMQHSEITAEQVGAKIGKSRGYVYARLKLLDLGTDARDRLLDGTIDASSALALARVPDSKLQLLALDFATTRDYQGERPSYRALQAWLQQNVMLRLDSARFKITDITLVPDAGDCKACSKRTGHEPDLFADVKSADVCTDPPCFHRKEEAHTARLLQQAHERGQTVITGREAKALMPNSWGSVEGYLRLDDTRDSPGDKPLRKLLGKQLEQSEVQVTLIDNPHKIGDLIAVLPAATVAALLKAQGHEDEAVKIKGDIQGDAKEKASKEKAELTEAYEKGWRNALLKRTYDAIVQANYGGGTGLSLGVQRHIATHFLNLCNTDAAKYLCKLLELGTVAPKDALRDLIAVHPQPADLVLLLVMQRNSGYTPWMPEDYAANAALLQIAADFAVDPEAVKATVKSDIKAQVAKAKKPPVAAAPAARAAEGAGGGAKGKAPVRKAKLSAEDATLGIAVAMQNIAAEPEGGGFGLGQTVCVTTDTEKLNLKQLKWAGKQGTITAKLGDSAWDVTFRGRGGGLASFDASEIEVVQS
jgi:ParB/RepB/Spo0J family partition protein